MRVTISGPPGSGKTTVAELVAKKLGMRLIMTGKIFREQARNSGMDVHEYNRLAETDRSIDVKLDEEIVRLASETDDVIIEGRLAGQLLSKNSIDSFKVFVTASPKIRAERIARREKTKVGEELNKLTVREESERKRYRDFYQIDIGDMSIYDLVVDSGNLSADQAANIVVNEIRMTKS